MTTLEHVDVRGGARRQTGIRWSLDDRWFVPLVGAADVAAAAGATLVLADLPSTKVLALLLPILWVSVLATTRQYGCSQLSSYRPGSLARPWCSFAGIAGVLCVLLGVGLPPAQFAVAVAVPLVASEGVRLGVRTMLRRLHRRAVAIDRVLVVGDAAEVDELAGALARMTFHEYVVVGVCATDPEGTSTVAPVVAHFADGDAVPVGEAQPRDDADRVLSAAVEVGASHVFVVPGRVLSGDRLRRLSWAVQAAGLALVLVPGLVAVEDHRLQVRSLGSLTLMEVQPPRVRSLWTLVKGVLDRATAAVLLVVLLPLLVTVGLVVRLDSTGPALFRQRRVGRDGREFVMLKFRSMVTNAEQLLADLTHDNEHDGLMFKMRRDPRITRVGWWLRRFSLDELPQLVNVLLGHMSLVGPRPPLPLEVAGYDEVELRRLRVKPGLTGLWQVSGRSDLTWDETVALDLHYVDNWTLGGDARLIARTAQAVVGGRGAY